MDQWVKALVAKFDDLSSIPGTQMIERRTHFFTLSPEVPLHPTSACMCVYTHAH